MNTGIQEVARLKMQTMIRSNSSEAGVIAKWLRKIADNLDSGEQYAGGADVQCYIAK